MTYTRRFVMAVSFVCVGCVSLQAQSISNAWEQLGLESMHIDRATVYYEKAFESNLPFFEKAYSELLSSWDQSKAVSAKRDTLLSEINHILGIEDPDAKLQNTMWASFMGAFSSVEKVTFYLVTQQTAKDYLREGGTLPDFTYDKAKDEVIYNFNLSNSSKDGPVKYVEWACPIESEHTFKKDVSAIFHILEQFVCKDMVDMTLHEIIEMSLLRQARPTDPYCRWFSDGVANAITLELLKTHFGMQRAEDFMIECDVKNYTELETDINLQYWLTGRSCLFLPDEPTEAGKRLTLARYAYATLEARRLIDTHGIDCVRAILDDIRSKPSRTGQDLLDTIHHVTGEAMQDRLSQYQTFQTLQEGIEKYAPAFNEASQEKDLEAMVFNLFRMHDLRPPSQAQQILFDYIYAGKLLFKMGKEQDADEVMENCVEFFSNPGFTHGRLMASEAFIVYALECNKPLKARQIAEELLKTSPDNVSGLTIQMFIRLDDKQLNEAKSIANRIISLSNNKESKNHKLAVAILAINPSAPNSKASQ